VVLFNAEDIFTDSSLPCGHLYDIFFFHVFVLTHRTGEMRCLPDLSQPVAKKLGYYCLNEINNIDHGLTEK
jgi:hypothetical protein